MAPVKCPCLKCDKHVSDNDKQGSIKCCVCERWAHAKCLNMDAALLNHFNNSYKTIGKHFWGCDGCTRGFHEVTIRVQAIKEEVKKLKETVTANTVNIDKVNDRVDKVEKQVAKDKIDLKQDKADIIKEAGAAFSRELRDRAGRKDNVIIYGLPEPPLGLTAGKERKTKDEEALAALFKEIKVVHKPEDIKFMVRQGELNERVTAKPRPLLIGLRTPVLKDQIFNGARFLKGSQNFFKISIVPDLTRQQREEDKALMDEADQKNNEMNEQEALNWEYRCVGKRGERTLARLKVNPNYPRSRGRGQRPGAMATGANTVQLGHRPAARSPTPRPSTSRDNMLTEEEESRALDQPGLLDHSSESEESEDSQEEEDLTTARNTRKKRNRSGTKSPRNKTGKKKPKNH